MKLKKILCICFSLLLLLSFVSNNVFAEQAKWDAYPRLGNYVKN